MIDQDVLDQVIAYLRAHARHGVAMTAAEYTASRPPHLPGHHALYRAGYPFRRLAEMAELIPAPTGYRREVRKPEDDAPQPMPQLAHGWPIFGIPTRREVVIFTADGRQPLDGDLVYRIERQYYSLR